MSFEQRVKALKLFKNGLVELEGSTSKFSFFKVKDYNIRYDRLTKLYSCTCEFSSFWGVNKSQTCVHIQAVILLQRMLSEYV